MNILETMQDDRFFKPLMGNLESWKAWEVYLKALFGLPFRMVEDGPILKACAGFETLPKGRYKESYVIAGRRSGKSRISALIAVYLAAFKDWSKSLAIGEQGHIFIVANDMSQAGTIKEYISGFLNSNPSFKRLIKKERVMSMELKNNVTITIKSCNFRSLRGYTLLAAILEEIAFYRTEESANPDKEILTALRPALATVKDSMLIGISTPYSRSGVLYEQFKKHYGKHSGTLIWKADSRTMNPTLDDSLIQAALKDDPVAAAAEWKAEFRSDVEAFLSAEMVDAAIIPRRLELPKIEGVQYFGFVDPSGGRQDSFTLAICHKEKSGKIVLDCIRERKPPFSPENVVTEYKDVLKSYKISQVEADRYAAEWVTDSFRRHEIRLKNSKNSKSKLYLNLWPLIANGTLELLDNKKLRSQLCSLERRTRSGGLDQVDNFFGHDDVANAVAGAAVMAASRIIRPRIRSLQQSDPEGWRPIRF